jgi:acyl-coenzyme A thioesterase PaaI-like protein
MKVNPDGSVPAHHATCFGCGPDNPAGIGLRMRVDGDHVRADLVFDERHQGAPGLAHGGAVAAALDDLFGGVLVMLEAPAVTANLHVDFRAPVPLGEVLALSASCTGSDGRKLTFRAVVQRGGRVLAEATALFVRVDLAHFEAARAPLPDAWNAWTAGGSRSDEVTRDRDRA